MTTPALIDIGANLTHDSFDTDRNDVLAAALAVGVDRLIVTGASEAGSTDAAALAHQRPGQLFATAGVHPHHASDWTDTTDAHLRGLLAKPEVVAAGECGLDYFRNYSTHTQQAHAFTRQLELAVESRKPVFLHQRDAHEPFLSLLDPMLPALTRGVAHCFTGRGHELAAYLERDLYIGITGWICDERRGRHLLELVGTIPDDRLMIETDAPYLLPRTLKPRPKSRRNEPRHLIEVLRVVAQARGQSEAHVAQITTANAERFFELPSAKEPDNQNPPSH
ncbi:MAG: TatD family hydrolase [Pseudomonadota bacterium]